MFRMIPKKEGFMHALINSCTENAIAKVSYEV